MIDSPVSGFLDLDTPGNTKQCPTNNGKLKFGLSYVDN